MVSEAKLRTALFKRVKLDVKLEVPTDNAHILPLGNEKKKRIIPSQTRFETRHEFRETEPKELQLW